MANLTSEQVNELANHFLAMAQATGKYRVKHKESLTEDEKNILRESHKRTLDYSDDLYTISATLVMDDVENSLTKLGSITKDIKKAYKNLEDVQKVINIATSVVTLGASIFSLNVQAIIDSMSNLKSAIGEEETSEALIKRLRDDSCNLKIDTSTPLSDREVEG